VSEVEKPSKSSDFVSLTREELGLILEAQDIIPLSLRKKEIQVFISLVDEYITNSWNWLKLDKLFLFFAGSLSVILIITGVFFPDVENIVLFCACVVFVVFYFMVFGVVPICFFIKRKGFRSVFQNLQNFLKFLMNICYYIFSHIYVIILGIVLGSLYVSWTKEIYILISAAWDWWNFSKISLIPVISTTVISLWIWLVSAKKYLELTHKKWCNLSISSILLAMLPSFANTLYLVIYIVQYVENENLIAKGADSQNKLLEMQQLFWLKINFLSIGFFIILLYGIAVAYDFELSKKYQLKYGSLFKKALFKNQN